MGRKEGEPFLAVGREEAQATQSRSVLAHLGGRWSLLLRTARSAHFVTCRPRGCGGIAVQVTHSHLSLPPLTHSHRSLTPHRRINPPPFITPPPVGSLLTHPLTSTSHTPPPLTHPHRSLSRTSHSPPPLTPTSLSLTPTSHSPPPLTHPYLPLPPLTHPHLSLTRTPHSQQTDGHERIGQFLTKFRGWVDSAFYVEATPYPCSLPPPLMTHTPSPDSQPETWGHGLLT